MRRRLVVDCFPFFNELAMLEYRLELLKDVVDYHVIIEATRTHKGNPKPLFFNANERLFEKHASRLIHIVIDDMPDSENPWVRENHQRDAGVSRGLKKVPGLENSDIVVVSDIDELPNPATVQKLREEGLTGFARLRQDLYYFEASRRGFQTSSWTHSFVGDAGTVSKCMRLSLARTDGTFPIIDDGGWHFSYFFPTELVLKKLEEFSHQENAIQRFATKEHVDRAIGGETTLFERERTRESPRFLLPPGTKELSKRILELAPLC
jgi:hypothetical protein